MNIYAFTSGHPYFKSGWHDEDVLTLFGNVTVDLVNVPSAEDAVLSVLVLFGNATVTVPTGAQIAIGGFSLFGKRSITITQEHTGPQIQLTLSAVLGNIRVVQRAPSPRIETSSLQAVTGQTVQLQPEERA